LMYGRLLKCLVCQRRRWRLEAMAKSAARGTMLNRGRHWLRAMLIASIAVSAGVVSVVPAGASGTVVPTAHAARTLNAGDTGRLHLLRASGSLLYEEGSASGGIPGRMKADMNIGATFTGSFTIYSSHGTIKGHGTATPHGSGRFESFSGSLVITGGSGRYAHARGSAGLFGTFDRKTYGFVVQTTGKLTY
jgi:hypothetical protein